MKLIIAIIQDEDASEVISHLNEAKFQVTRLSTKGGFLRAGNTTIMTGVEDDPQKQKSCPQYYPENTCHETLRSQSLQKNPDNPPEWSV